MSRDLDSMPERLLCVTLCMSFSISDLLPPPKGARFLRSEFALWLLNENGGDVCVAGSLKRFGKFRPWKQCFLSSPAGCSSLRTRPKEEGVSPKTEMRGLLSYSFTLNIVGLLTHGAAPALDLTTWERKLIHSFHLSPQTLKTKLLSLPDFMDIYFLFALYELGQTALFRLHHEH